MELVAKTYANYEQIGDVFQKNGKNYIKVKSSCDRCGGRGFSNHPSWTAHADNGECFKCFGKGYVIEEVRAYSQKEFDAMERAAKKKEDKKEADRIAKIDEVNANYKIKAGFEHGHIVAVVGNTFPIKDSLKEMGAKFGYGFGWYFVGGTIISTDIIFETLQINWEDVSVLKGDYVVLKDEAVIKQFITEKTFKPSASTYQGTIGERMVMNLTIKSVYELGGRFGDTFMHSMEDENGNVFIWTTASKNLPVGNTFKMRVTIKDHKEYKGVLQTILTRCTIMN
jgi:hypothetical protein